MRLQKDGLRVRDKRFQMSFTGQQVYGNLTMKHGYEKELRRYSMLIQQQAMYIQQLKRTLELHQLVNVQQQANVSVQE